MEEPEQTTEGGEQDELQELDRIRPEPRIYVASLSDYNAGRLHGVWLNAAQEPEQLAEAVQAMLRASPEPWAEEFAIHDYEHFGPLHLDEYESLDTISMLAKGVVEHGPAFAHWVTLIGTREPEALARFETAYLGHFDSLTKYGEHILDDFGLRQEFEESVPELLSGYVNIDVTAFARDLELSGNIKTSEGGGGVYVFEGE